MKYILALLLSIIFYITTFSQENASKNYSEIIRLDTIIQSIDFYRYYPYCDTTKIKLKEYVPDSLIPLLSFAGSDEKFEKRLLMISTPETITWLVTIIHKEIQDMHGSSNPEIILKRSLWEKRKHQVEDRLDEIFDSEISDYRYPLTSEKWIKYLYIDHVNDVLFLPKGYNDDRDLTGGFRLEIGTDKLKMRLFGSGHITNKYFDFLNVFNWNDINWYSSQGLFAGGEGYTPYLRDTSIFNSYASFDSLDRPYASYKYIGRVKYRLHRKGNWKMKSEFKVGTIGSDAPDGIQALIHRDITVTSAKPMGWGSQIANGGRLGLSYGFEHNIMLIGKDRRWFRFKRKKKKIEWFNLSGIVEGNFGHDITFAGLGLNISNKSFRESGVINLPFIGVKRIDFLFNYKFTARYIQHNSMLEGYGIWTTDWGIDEHPSTPKDIHVIDGDNITRWLYIHEITFGIKLRHMGIIYKLNIWNSEFDLPVNSKAYPVGMANGVGNPNGVSGNHNVNKNNHVGTIGLVFNI